MWVAHGHGGKRELPITRAQRASHQALASWRRNRDLGRIQLRSAHLDRHRFGLTVACVDPAFQQSCPSVDAQHRTAQRGIPLVEELGHAADAVATHLSLAPVGVDHPHAGIAVHRRQDGEHAVAAHAEVAVAQRTHHSRISRSRHFRRRLSWAQVDDEEIVPQPLGLDEGNR